MEAAQGAANALRILKECTDARTSRAHSLNSSSSRSHFIFTIALRQKSSGARARLCFVDLAGSERVKETEASGIAHEEVWYEARSRAVPQLKAHELPLGHPPRRQ